MGEEKIRLKDDFELDSVRLEPVGLRFITGLASSYDDDYPMELRDVLPREEFMYAMNRINRALSDYWPCCM
jgi:hypothetical protein